MTTMRAPRNEATGTSGQSFVKAQLEALGWGAVPNPEHDLGTDLWLMARDIRRFDLGALVGAQVKTGVSYFADPELVDGEAVGWWYREDDDRHFRYWAEHNVPHILVLHREADHVSFWAEITADKVVSTGAGRKILVSAESTIDPDHFDELLAVSASKASAPQWEGSAWKVGVDVPEASRLRYALVTPRLIAPHPNLHAEGLTAHQAIALLVQMRMRDLGDYQDVEPRVDPTLIPDDADFQWLLYVALRTWILSGDLGYLVGLNAQDLPAEDRAAIAVCLAHGLFENGQTSEAAAVLDLALTYDDYNPVDIGWLRVQKARVALDAGLSDVAKDLAFQVQALRSTAPADPTARAFVGSATQTIFQLADWGAGQVADVIQSRDTVASWWRTQTLVEALGDQFDQTFKAWGHDQTVTFAAEDVVLLRLRSGMLLAGYAGDSGAWRYAACLLAKRHLMSPNGPQSYGVALHLLRFAGADKELELTAERLLQLGPVAPLTEAGSTLELSRSTRTSVKADLALLRVIGDVLTEADCDRHLSFALQALASTPRVVESQKPHFWFAPAVIHTIAGLTRGASADGREQVRDYLMALPTVDDQLSAGRYGELIRCLDVDEWTDAQVETLAHRENGDCAELTQAIEWVIAQRDPAFRDGLIDRIKAGDLSALNAYGNVTALPVDAAEGMITTLARQVVERTTAARNGTFGFGGADVLRALVLLNTWHPAVAQWDPCIDALTEPQSHAEHILGAIRLIGSVAQDLTAEVRAKLQQPIADVSTRSSKESDFFGFFAKAADAAGAATLTLATLRPDSITDARLVELLLGDKQQRTAAVQIIVERRDSTTIGTLAALASDPDIGVRTEVARGVTSWVDSGIAESESLMILARLLDHAGVQLALRVSGMLAGLAPDVRGRISALLADSASATVRSRVAHAVAAKS